MKIKFISLASGSSGNCYFLGTDRYGILVDAGIGIRTIKKTLKELGIGLDIIRAVFITHDHADHIKAVGHLGEKFGIPVYSTPEVHAGINKSYCMTEKLSTCVHYLHKGETMELEDFAITAFEVPHDGTDNVGYCMNIDGKIFSFLTDLGHITPTAAEYICKANYLVLEANYDEEMLKNQVPAHLPASFRRPRGVTLFCSRSMTSPKRTASMAAGMAPRRISVLLLELVPRYTKSPRPPRPIMEASTAQETV